MSTANTDIVTVRAGIWNYWLHDDDGENPAVPVGNSIFPRWKPAQYGRISLINSMYADVHVRINHVNKSRFFYDVFWMGMYNPSIGTTSELDSLYKPGQMYLEIILHKKN